MNQSMSALLKLSALGFYLAALLSPVVNQLAPYQSVFFYSVVVLAVVHALEYALLRGKLAAVSDESFKHLINTMLFGFIYWAPLFKAQKAAA